ncbi:MAG TPA: hypothetical protein VNY34_00935 [Solirubrobacteraceae bacterium]|nr:hypothetical protein [Solirubrobacteraceae bacterium]
MPSSSEIREQVARESERRSRLAVPAFAGGVLYLLSAIIIASTLNSAPNVGLFQGLEPALRGEANPRVSPRADEVKFISHHAFGLVAGSALAAVAIGALTLVLLLLADATRFRRPGMWAAARPLVLFGGIAVALVSLSHQVISAVQTHNFAVGHDFSNHAVDQALTKGTLNLLTDYLALLAGLALAAGVVTVAMNAQRVGLIPRWMGIVGIFTGLLIFLPIGGAELQIVPAFWLVMMGVLYLGRWSKGDPPAWAAGEARPWPTQAELRAARESGGSPQPRSQGAKPAPSSQGQEVAPAPAQPAAAGSSRASRKRRRKRRARG